MVNYMTRYLLYNRIDNYFTKTKFKIEYLLPLSVIINLVYSFNLYLTLNSIIKIYVTFKY